MRCAFIQWHKDSDMETFLKGINPFQNLVNLTLSTLSGVVQGSNGFTAKHFETRLKKTKPIISVNRNLCRIKKSLRPIQQKTCLSLCVCI